MTGPVTGRAAPRGRGVRAGIDRRQVVAAARALRPANLTVQAVADALGVDRKAVRHHVENRDRLVGMVAWDLFSDRLEATPAVATQHWRLSCRNFAIAVAEAAFSAGPFAAHLVPPLWDHAHSYFITRTERVLDDLTGAGLADDDALACVVLLTNTAIAFGRDRYQAQSGQAPLRPQLLRHAVDAAAPEQLPHLRRMLDARIDTYAPRQLDISIDILLSGIAERLRCEGRR